MDTLSNRQNGAALITALIFMVMLTMLALGAMNTSTLEEKMAANSQAINRAFRAAEAGLEMAFENVNAFKLTNTADKPYAGAEQGIGSYGADAEFSVVYRQATTPRRGARWDSNYAFYHFGITSTGETKDGASATIHAGAYQVGYR